MDFGSSMFYSRQDRNYTFPSISLSMICHDEPLSEVQFKSYKTRLQEYKNYLDSVNRLANCVNVCITEEPVSIGETGLLTGEALNALQHAGSISVYNFFQQHNWEYPSNPEGEMAVVRPHNPVADEFLDSEQPIRPDWPSVHLTKCFVDQDKAKLHGSALPLRNYLPPTISFRNAADVDDAIEPEPRPSKQMLSQEGDFEIVSTEQGIMVQKYVKEGKEAQLMPLYEYYYGRIEGKLFNPVEKGEYRFSCASCQITLYSNLAAIEHILSHTDERIMKLFKTSDIIQCQTCGKMLGNAFELRNHMEAEHMSVIGPDGEQRVYIDTNNGNIICTISCRICEKTCDSNFALAYHLQNSHRENEMPYRCGICNFHTSLYQDVIGHFKKMHSDTNELICPYCLRIFVIQDSVPMSASDPPGIVTGVGQTSLFLQHLKTHKDLLFKHCTGCTLNFINKTDFELHRRLDHKTQVLKTESYPDYKTPFTALEAAAVDMIADQSMDDSPVAINTATTSLPQIKRMNAPEPSRVKDLSNLVVPDGLELLMCIECGDSLILEKHKRYLPCSLCRFASCCAEAFHRHVLRMHTNSKDDVELAGAGPLFPCGGAREPGQARAEDFFCSKCAITNLDGNALTSHLVDECGVSMVTLRPDPHLLAARQQAEREHETAAMVGLEEEQHAEHAAPGPAGKSALMFLEHGAPAEGAGAPALGAEFGFQHLQQQMGGPAPGQAESDAVGAGVGVGGGGDAGAQMMMVEDADAMEQQALDDPNTHTISIPEGINLKPGESLVLLICENNTEEFIIINTADINTPEMQEFFTNRRSQNVYVVQSNDEIPDQV